MAKPGPKPKSPAKEVPEKYEAPTIEVGNDNYTEAQLDQAVRSMIDKMSRNVSIDMNKHQIQASILCRMEAWAERKGVDWDSRLPKHMKFIKECAEARYGRVQNFLAKQREQREQRLRDIGVEAAG